MASEYKTGLVITGDASGGVRAINTTKTELDKLNQDFRKGRLHAGELGSGFDQAGGKASAFARQIQSAGNDLGWMGDQAKSVAATMGGIFAGFQTVSLFGSAIAETEQLERNLLRTEAVIKATGGVAGVTAQELHQQARELALSTLQSTEGVMHAQQILLSYSNITGDVFTRAIETATDLSSLINGPLNGSLEMLAKVLDDPIQGINAMRRQGIYFDDAQQKVIKTLVETNRLAEAQGLILDELAGQFGGIARKEAEGFGGAQDTLGQAIQEAKLALAEQLSLIETGTEIYNRAAEAVFYLRDNMSDVVAVGEMVAVVLGAKLTGAIAAKTAATVKSTLADRAAAAQAAQLQLQEQQVAAMAARRTAGEQTAAVTRSRIAQQRAQQAQAEAAQQLRQIQLTQQQLAAERALEMQRLQAQISATGRQQSLTRLAEIRQQELRMAAQATAAQRTLAAAEATTTGTTRALTLAETELARANTVVTTTTAAAAASTRTASVAQAAMTATSRTLATSMALLGGPAGIAIIAAGSLYMFRDELFLSAGQADKTKARVAELTAGVDDFNQAVLETEVARLTLELSKLEDKAKSVAVEVKDAMAAPSGASGFGNITPLAKALGKQQEITVETKAHNEALEETKKKLAKVVELQGLLGNRPGSTGLPGADDDKKTASMRDQAQKWLLEMQRFNATEQQQVEHWRQDSLAQTESYYRQGLVSHRDYEFAKVAIAEEAARRLQAIEDERWGKFLGGSLAELGKLQQDAQGLEGPKGQLVQRGIGREIKSKTFQGLPEIKGLDAQFSGPFGEAQRMEQEREKMREAYDQRIEDYKLYREMEIENAALYDEQITALEDRRRQNELAAERQIQQAKLQGVGETFGSMADLAKVFAGEQSGIYRTMFAAQKAYNLASVLMSSVDAIGKAWASAPFPFNLPAVATTTVQTGVLQAMVQSVAMPVGQAHDGIDYLPKSGTWNLERGERVTGAALNRDLTQFLDRENRQGGARGGAGPISVSVEVINQGQPVQARTRTRQISDREFVAQVILEEASSGQPTSGFSRFAQDHGLTMRGS
ncbi:hypothetical protein [Zobellella sp. DQSA1]|uniref:hypothetical protein n=1 Tax=Zobellella sp. DQSA1 TaxID=3342386 RepID=UPI0035C141D7